MEVSSASPTVNGTRPSVYFVGHAKGTCYLQRGKAGFGKGSDRAMGTQGNVCDVYAAGSTTVTATYSGDSKVARNAASLMQVVH